MSTQQLTDWFPGDVKPVRVGVYEVQDEGGVGKFSEWNGEHWGLRTNILRFASDWSNPVYRGFKPTANQRLKWRGLAADPFTNGNDEQTDDHTGICMEAHT